VKTPHFVSNDKTEKKTFWKAHFITNTSSDRGKNGALVFFCIQNYKNLYLDMGNQVKNYNVLKGNIFVQRAM
jgi:hypothetical protein